MRTSRPEGLFECNDCGDGGCKAYDAVWKRWRHLNFFQHEAFLHAPAPRVKVSFVRDPAGAGAVGPSEERVQWRRRCRCGRVGRIVGEHDTQLWRIVKHYVDEARAAADHGGVRAVGVDEKACRWGHSHATFFADLEKRRLLYATPRRTLPPDLAALHLELWCLHAEESELAPMVKVAGTKHSAGILRWLHSRISNGMLEAMNSLVQAAKVRARGYRSIENFITMGLPLVCGKLTFNLPTVKQRGGKSVSPRVGVSISRRPRHTSGFSIGPIPQGRP